MPGDQDGDSRDQSYRARARSRSGPTRRRANSMSTKKGLPMRGAEWPSHHGGVAARAWRRRHAEDVSAGSPCKEYLRAAALHRGIARHTRAPARYQVHESGLRWPGLADALASRPSGSTPPIHTQSSQLHHRARVQESENCTGAPHPLRGSGAPALFRPGLLGGRDCGSRPLIGPAAGSSP